MLLFFLGCTGTIPVDSNSLTATETGSGSQQDTGVALETVPGVDEPDRAAGVCQVTVDCPGEIPDEPKLGCQLRVASESGRVYYDGPAGLELRGRSSNSAPKHQYAVELWDLDGQSHGENLLGMGSDSDWVLHGNYFDRLLMRNRLGYDLFQSWGGPERYAAESAWCELTLDGSYQGVYTLVERIKRDDDRIALADDEGGAAFIVKHHDTETLFDLRMSNGGFKLVYPNPNTATPQEVAAVTARLQSWEAAVYSTDPANPATGVFAHVDLDSAVDLVLLEEFVKNNDAFYLSMHIWQDVDGLMHFVPWDLDLSLGQPSYNDNENPETWIAYRPEIISVMASTALFQVRLVERWAELRSGPLATGAVLATLDAHQTTLGEAIDRNFQTWPIESIDFYGYLYAVDSYAEEDARVRAWVAARLAWMDTAIGSY
jgi:hypothetical protein